MKKETSYAQAHKLNCFTICIYVTFSQLFIKKRNRFNIENTLSRFKCGKKVLCRKERVVRVKQVRRRA